MSIRVAHPFIQMHLTSLTVLVVNLLWIRTSHAGYFAETGSLREGRYSHAAALLQNGKVLVVGGNSMSGYSTSTEVYDPNAGTWTESGRLILGRVIPTATT